MAGTAVLTEARSRRAVPHVRWSTVSSPGHRLKAAVILTDAATLVVGLVLAYQLRGLAFEGARPERHDSSVVLAAAAMPLWLWIFARYRLYGARQVMSRLDETNALIHATGVSIVITAGAASLVGFHAARGWLVIAVFVLVPLLTVERLAVRSVIARMRRRGRLLRPVVIVGDSMEARAVGTELAIHPRLGYKVLGYVRTGADTVDAPDVVSLGPPVLGHIDGIRDHLATTGAEGVIIATTGVDCLLSNRLARELTCAGLHVELTSSLNDITSKRLSVRSAGRFPLVHVEPVRHGWRAVAKRAFDVVGAATALIVLSPVLVLIAALVKATSPGPILFRQARVGRNGSPFELLKFRSMVVDAEEAVIDLVALNETDGPMFKIRNDPRVTRVGQTLRRFSLDELPQLWNVIKGDMSLVGPRPALHSEMAGWPTELHQRLRVRPGLTGMWQVSGRSNAPFEDYVRLDLYYVDNWSLLNDLVIIVRTVPVVCLGRGGY